MFIITYKIFLKDGVLHYLTARNKWSILRTGPLAQNLPFYINGREQMSVSRANALNVPFDQAEAEKRFDELVAKFDTISLGDQKTLKPQMEIIVKMLQLGSYSLPKKVIESDVVQTYLFDVLEKDFNESMNALRKGNRLTILIRVQ